MSKGQLTAMLREEHEEINKMVLLLREDGSQFYGRVGQLWIDANNNTRYGTEAVTIV